jgi:CMP-N,N'-diacetyllegionaminic acid synthase
LEKIEVRTLAIIPARAGSRGVPRKNIRELLDKPVISYTIESALAAETIDQIVITSDDADVIAIGKEFGIETIDRPKKLADDSTRIDDVMRHACNEVAKPDLVVLLYANIPIRATGVIDRAIEKLITTGGDSVQTMSPVGKFHPYWLYNLEEDKAAVYIENQIDRRQNLPPLYYIDGAVGAVRYDCLMAAAESDHPHAFWGEDRRALTQQAHETVDIDTLRDFYLAEVVLREQGNTNCTGLKSVGLQPA